VKLKEVFLPHPFHQVSGLLLKIFSIWLAHALGSDKWILKTIKIHTQ
jgi:hypothetical protein